MAFFGRESAADAARAARIKAWAEARTPFALYSLLLGIVAAVDFFTVLLGIGLGIGAVLLGRRGLRDIQAQPLLAGRRMCLTGITLGVVGIVAGVVMAFVYALARR